MSEEQTVGQIISEAGGLFGIMGSGCVFFKKKFFVVYDKRTNINIQ